MRARTSTSPSSSASASQGSPGTSPGAGAPGDGADAHAELARLATDLRGAALDVAWRQWRALGAGTSTRSGRAHGVGAMRGAPEGGRSLRTLVDPEALVLVSLALMPEERRLGDLLHDWGARNSDLLSVQRVKNLAGGYLAPAPETLAPRLAWFAAVARDAGKDLRWRAVAQAWAAAGDRAGVDAPAQGGVDDYRRVDPRIDSRAAAAKVRATRARLTAPASLVLRLRLGFGVGVKADLLAVLLARAEDWITVRDLVGATAYTTAAVRRAADDLAAARLIRARDGQPAGYRVDGAAWGPLLGLEGPPPGWGSWHERFAFTAAFLGWAESARARPLSPYALGAHGRRLMEEHRPAFERDGVAVWSAHSPIQDWATYLTRSVQSLVGWMLKMA